MAAAILGGLALGLLPMIAGKIFGHRKRSAASALLVRPSRRSRRRHRRVRGRGILYPYIKTRGRGVIRVSVHRQHGRGKCRK